jgi:hypothetical protein
MPARSSSRPLCGRIETLPKPSRRVEQSLDTAPGGAYSTNALVVERRLDEEC